MFDSRAAPVSGQVAGYRVMRRLARDADAEVLLGFRAAEAPDESTVVLKVRPATAANWLSTMVLTEALERARGDHVVAVRDFSATEDSICVVFQRLPRGDLAGLLRGRHGLDAGEAVTILAPLAATIERMHHAGVAHGALSARTVLFRDDGAPVLIGFGIASLFPPAAPEVDLEQETGVRDDRVALRVMAIAVLAQVSGPRAFAAATLIRALESCADELVASTLNEGIFEVAAAIPVRFVSDDADSLADSSSSITRLPAVKVVPLAEEAVGDKHTRPERVVTARLGRVVHAVVPTVWTERVGTVIARAALAPASVALARRWRSLSTTRRRATVAVVAATVALLFTAMIVPSRVGLPDASSTPSVPVTAPTSGPSTPEPVSSAFSGDDPVAAATALLLRRRGCIHSLSVQCLNEVDQADSTALAVDRQMLSAVQRGGELIDPFAADSTETPTPAAGETAPVLVERLGDSALLRWGPAETGSSILIVKSSGGWLIRDLIAMTASPD